MVTDAKTSQKSSQTFILKVYRGSPGNQYWESFRLPLVPSLNVISALMRVQKEPVNADGVRVTPVVWEQGCLEEVCGSCSMLIDRVPRQACSALIAELLRDSGTNCVLLAPLSKFPLIRDLIVDRSAMFNNLKKVHAWVESDGAYDRGGGPKISQAKQERLYQLSTCMTCGCCAEACPQVNEHSSFMGPAAIAQADLFNHTPMGEPTKPDRMRALMEEGGIQGCGNAQNCVRVCPKKIPLTDSIASVGRDATAAAIQELLGLGYRGK